MSQRPISAEERQSNYDFPVDYGGHSIGNWASGLFLLILATFHASLLFSYFMIRQDAPRWPPDGYAVPPLDGVLITTLIMIASAIPAGLALWAIRRDRPTLSMAMIIITSIAGIVFLVLQLLDLERLDLRPIDTVYSSLVAALMGYQALFMLVALLMAAVICVRLLLAHFSSQRYMAVQAFVMLWWFLVVSWLAMGGTIYLSPYVT